jgi:glutathione S-transferase
LTRTVLAGGLHPEINLPHSQQWELYHNGFSLCSKKLRVCMAELNVPYRGHHVHLIETGSYESCSPAYLEINPSGTVPVLVHQGHPVYESHDQIVYLAEHAGDLGESLIPEDSAERKLMERWVDCASISGDPLSGLSQRAGHCIPGLTLPIFAAMVQYIPYKEILKGLLTHPNKERPLIFAVMKLRGQLGSLKIGKVKKLIDASRHHMSEHLDDLGAQLQSHGKSWVLGDAFTLADVSWVVILDRLVEVDWADHFWGDGKREQVEAYWRRLQDRPSYREQVVAQRCDITLNGIADVAALKRSNAKYMARLIGE